ncbi:MAG TPA: LysR family transcriptional regulator [Eggerthellaceae bacterium]|nr:LysR family transcriptional regulator [Eggerthellaceae bacterium]
MQLQQLRYVVAAAESGSFRAAAQKLFVSQSSISIAVKDLEQETGTTFFTRTSRGITLTNEGMEFIGYAKPILEQFDSMGERYSRERAETTRFVVSSLHNLIVARAFGDFISQHDSESCNFALRETYTNQIIRDVQEGESDLGIIYTSLYSAPGIEKALEYGDLAFTSLFVAQPYIVVGDGHPLAGKDSVGPEELASYDRYELEQGFESSSYYPNEPISQVPHKRKIVLSDNSSLAAILAQNDGYTLTTGISPANRSLTLVRLDTQETMNVGYIRQRSRPKEPLAEEFLALLAKHILVYGDAIDPAPGIAAS